jgi:DNA invertase Pin-like site-specific DNA recombinase
MADIAQGKIDVVVCYKIDRLSRSLLDFTKLVEVFDRYNVTFVSTTQQFNTTTSMGRLTLNMLLSFAQFEREVIGERIRDKIAASRRRGIWMGGWAPMGYGVKDRKLVIQEAEANTVRMLFEQFVKLGSATKLVEQALKAGVKSKHGRPLDKSFLYKMLNNPVYVGEAVHKGTSYPGEHEAIVSRALWDKVRAIMKVSPHKRAGHARAKTPALLKGLIFGPNGLALTPTHTRRKGKLYRYYISTAVASSGRDACEIGRIPAAEIERAVIDQVRTLVGTPEIVVGTWKAARKGDRSITEASVRAALASFEDLWSELFPAEQSRIVELLVERVDVLPDQVSIRFKIEGLASLVAEFQPDGAKAAA